jgi:hypothetical protein
MSEFGMDCTTPVGRIVAGHPTKPQPKKHQDGPLKGKPMIGDDGQVVMEVFFAVAFSKQDFATHIWPTMAAEIATGYPSGVPQRFSYKYVDGDTVDSKGKPYAEREGYAGCHVLTITQRINGSFGVPPIFQLNPATNQYDQLSGDAIKCGDWVSVGINMKVNVATGTFTPSIYINPKAVELVAYGQQIVSRNAPDANELFGGRAHTLPPGASATLSRRPARCPAHPLPPLRRPARRPARRLQCPVRLRSPS